MRAVRSSEVVEALPFVEFSVQINVAFVAEKLVELLLIKTVGTFDFAIELRGAPFDAYRWSRATGSTRSGHPAAGAAHYGVVCAKTVQYAVPMIRHLGDAPDALDPTFFLNTDMWDL